MACRRDACAGLPASVWFSALVTAVTACSGGEDLPAPTHRIIQGAAPGQSGTLLTERPSLPAPEITADDVAFVRHMIVHHGQALQMTELVEARSGREDVPLFAERIQLSQEDEIRLMQDWLQTHRLAVLRIDEAGGGTAPTSCRRCRG